jgi:hypothetical protein
MSSEIGNGRVYHPALKPAQFPLCRHGCEGGYEQPKELFAVYLTAKKLVWLIFRLQENASWV